MTFKPRNLAKQWITRIIKNLDNNNWEFKTALGVKTRYSDATHAFFPLSRIYRIYGESNQSLQKLNDIISNLLYSNVPSILSSPNINCKLANLNHNSFGSIFLGISNLFDGIAISNDFGVGLLGMYAATGNVKYANTFKELNDYFGNYSSYLHQTVNIALHYDNLGFGSQYNPNSDFKYLGENIYNTLLNAPCDGMQWRIKSHDDRGTYLWNQNEKHNKFIRSFYDANITKGGKGIIHGLEYMLLHNLYLIKTSGYMTRLQTKNISENQSNVIREQDIILKTHP